MEELNDIIPFRENLGIITRIRCICTTAQEQHSGNVCAHVGSEAYTGYPCSSVLNRQSLEQPKGSSMEDQ